MYLASLNIGALWFGIGKVENIKNNGLDFVIMIAIKKVSENKFRKDMFKSKRKSVAEIWIGNNYLNIANIVRFAPSACNSQPWYVESKEKELIVYRYKKLGKRGIMPIDKVDFYNNIDIGIFILFMDLCLYNDNVIFDKEVFNDISTEDVEKTLIAKYILK